MLNNFGDKFDSLIKEWKKNGYFSYRFPKVAGLLADEDYEAKLLDHVITNYTKMQLNEFPDQGNFKVRKTFRKGINMKVSQFYSRHSPPRVGTVTYTKEVIANSLQNFFADHQRSTYTVTDLEEDFMSKENMASFHLGNLKTVLDETKSGCTADGIHTPWIIILKKFSFSPMYNAELELGTVYLHISGDPVVIILAEQSQAKNLKKRANQFAAHLGLSGCKDVLSHDIFFLDPRKLKDTKMKIVILRKGDLIMIPPRVPHCYISMGTAALQSVNFGSKLWISYGITCKPDNCACTATIFKFDFFPVVKEHYSANYYEYCKGIRFSINNKVTARSSKVRFGPFESFEEIVKELKNLRYRGCQAAPDCIVSPGKFLMRIEALPREDYEHRTTRYDYSVTKYSQPIGCKYIGGTCTNVHPCFD